MEPTSVLRESSDISKIRNVGALQEHELEKRREERKKDDVGKKTRNQRAPEGISRLEIPKLGEERALPSMRFPEASAAVAQNYRRADRLPDVYCWQARRCLAPSGVHTPRVTETTAR